MLHWEEHSLDFHLMLDESVVLEIEIVMSARSGRILRALTEAPRFDSQGSVFNLGHSKFFLLMSIMKDYQHTYCTDTEMYTSL